MPDVKDAIIEIIKWIRESVRPVVVILVLSALLLFFPAHWASSIGLEDGFSKYRLAALLCFVGSAVWLLTFPIEKKYQHRERTKRLHELTQHERDCLKPYILNRKRTNYFGWSTIADARSLVEPGILIETETQDGGGAKSFEISSWAYSYLCAHPELISTPKISN